MEGQICKSILPSTLPIDDEYFFLVHVHSNIYENFWRIEMVNRLLPQSTKYTQENEEEDVNGVRYLKSTINTTQPTPQAGEWLQVEYGYYGDNLGVVSGNR